jgi:tripartite-type tricarboxylate transporter receptor subunit TctC
MDRSTKPNLAKLSQIAFVAALLGVLDVIAHCVLAQTGDWPSRPVTVIGPYAPGGNNDVMARLASQWLSENLNQRFVVENKVGAGGALAATYVAQSAPDGYTLLFAASPQIGLVPYVQKVNYDPIKDFVPISAFGSGPFMLAINAAIPAKTAEEFVAYAKARPINYGSAGIASVGHLSAALFVAHNKLNATHVPFRGGGPAMIALLGGQIDMYFGNASEIIPNAENGSIRILGVAADRPLRQLPQVPVIKDNAVPTWNGFFAPAKTPRPIVDKLAQSIIAATRNPAITASLLKLGIEPNGITPEEFADWIKKDETQFNAAIEAAQLKQQQ